MNTASGPQLPQAASSLCKALRKHVWLFLAWSLTASVAGIAICYLIPQQWPASMLFQVGQVGSGGSLLADPNNVVQRVKFPGFVNQVLQVEQLPVDENLSRRSALIKKTLTASIVKGGNLLEMSVHGNSPEEAKANLLGAFQVLQGEHAELLLPSATRLEKNLADAKASLHKMESERSAILEPIRKANSASTIERKFSESILLASMLKSSESEMRIFRDQINTLDEQLSPYRTFNTKAVAPVYVPLRAVYPKKSVAAISGLLLGLLLASIYVFIRDEALRGSLLAAFQASSDNR